MNTDEYKQKGQAEVKKAEKSLKGTFFSNMFVPKEEKIEKAQKHYQ